MKDLMFYYKKANKNISNPIVTMEVENFGTIKIELYPDQAPETVSNFIKLANNGFYNGLKFHRVVKDFMIQGGDKKGDGTGTPSLADFDSSIERDSSADTEYCIEGEFIANGHNENTLKMEKGVIAMARSDYSSISSSLTTKGYNSAGSQFFIMTADNSSLDGNYAPFGKVIEGMDIVHNIEKVEVKASSSGDETNTESTEESTQTEVSTPVNDVIISKITVETYGVDYGKPETLETWNYYDWAYKTYGIDLRQYSNN